MSPLVAAVVLTSFALILTGAQGRPMQPDVAAKNGSNAANDKVWFLNTLLSNGSYVLSCKKHTLAALTSDNTTVVFYNLENETIVAEFSLRYPGISILLSGDEKQVIVTQNASTLSIFDLTTYASRTVYWAPAGALAANVFAAGDLVCGSPYSVAYYYEDEYYYSDEELSCLNIKTYQTESCEDIQLQPEGNVVSSRNGSMIYTFIYTNSSSEESIGHLTTGYDDQCVTTSFFCNGVDYQCSDYELCENTQLAWFSYDETAIFRQHGLALSTSNAMDCSNDLVPRGRFDREYPIGTYTYKYISHCSKFPHFIAVLRDSDPYSVYVYDWPELTYLTEANIPTGGVEIYGTEQVHYCSADEAYVIATYDQGVGLETGVAYVDMITYFT